MVSTTSVKKIAALTGACALGIAAITFYDHRAVAQTAKPAPPHMSPGQSVEMIAPAAVITSTVHYQAELNLTCSAADSDCFGDFRQPAVNSQLNITRISCFLDASAGSTFSNGSISLIGHSGSLVLQEVTPLDFSSSEGAHSLNSAVDLQIAHGQHMYVDLVLATGTPSFGLCTATGTLSTLG